MGVALLLLGDLKLTEDIMELSIGFLDACLL
jgi:hypothetical protein